MLLEASIWRAASLNHNMLELNLDSYERTMYSGVLADSSEAHPGNHRRLTAYTAAMREAIPAPRATAFTCREDSCKECDQAEHG